MVRIESETNVYKHDSYKLNTCQNIKKVLRKNWPKVFQYTVNLVCYVNTNAAKFSFDSR